MSQTSSAPTPALRLHYLDGIRGLAAFYVLLHHGYLQVTGLTEAAVLTETFPAIVLMSTKWLEYGSFSVATFIVLSGYCLMLPVVKTGTLRGGWLDYLKRRAKRILPPYYAALVMSLLLILIFPILNHPSHTLWDVTEGSLSIPTIVSHLFLLQNLSGKWAAKIDYPMWTVAIEWQIYFLLPIVLMPLWRRFGLVFMTIAAIVLGFGPHYLLHGYLDWIKPWYFSLFAIGAAAAVVSTSTEAQYVSFRQRLPWGRLTIFLTMLLIAIAAPQNRLWIDTHEVITDPLVGLVVGCLLVQCTETAMLGKPESKSPRTWALKLFSKSWATGLGAFSYSLYLVHAPILALIDIPLRNAEVSPLVRLTVGLGISVPIALGLSYLFYLLCERPLMRQRDSNSKAQKPV